EKLPTSPRVRHQENPDSGPPRPLFCVAARVAADAIPICGRPHPGWSLPSIQHGFQAVLPVIEGMANRVI
ncbi:hypothetical protein NO135_23605, partial [Clostridioides difficile]|nr:hypothetical protein [Clostridioides difficile]